MYIWTSDTNSAELVDLTNNIAYIIFYNILLYYGSWEKFILIRNCWDIYVIINHFAYLFEPGKVSCRNSTCPQGMIQKKNAFASKTRQSNLFKLLDSRYFYDARTLDVFYVTRKASSSSTYFWTIYAFFIPHVFFFQVRMERKLPIL